MTNSLSSYEKLEKLIKVCIFKRWSCEVFIRFCNQLQETCDFDDLNLIGNSLFSVANVGGPLEPLFLEYICGLASDSKSLFPLPYLVDYLKDSNVVRSGVKADVLIFIGKSFPSWNNPGMINDMKKSLGEYILKVVNDLNGSNGDKKELLIEYKSIGYFLIKLGEYSGLMLSLESSTSSCGFQNGLKRFINSNNDKFIEKHLKVLYKSVLDDKELDSNVGGENNVINGNGSTLSPSKHSRVYRLLWLESLMLTASKIQGNSFIREVNIFFAGETTQSIINKLITTSFDCLAVALQRKDLPIYIPLWKGFIGKRLPLIIKKLQGNIPSIESSICQPISMLDRNTVNLLRVYGGGDALDEMFSSFPSTTSDIRHEFLQSCIDMGLIKREAIQQTLGEDANVVEDNRNSYGPPRSNYLLRKDGNQVSIEEVFKMFSNENPEHVLFDESVIVWLINIFDEIDGYRQEKIAKWLLKYVEDWTNNQQTNSLSRVCQALSLNTNTLDVLFLHITPISLLVPLIRFLDNWRDDEDENDFQEVYAHFGCVFLFIEVVYRRYSLSRDDLEEGAVGEGVGEGAAGGEEQIPSQDEKSFWLNYITSSVKDSFTIDDMADDRKVLLGDWISALYDAGGISDELMRLSSIQDLIILVPTIFQQSITACANDIIDQDTLKGGLDYFLQPFLLPTLLGAFKYLCNCLWSSNDFVQVLSVLNMLVSPSGLSPEAANVHKIVLSIVSTDIKSSLLDVKSRMTKEYPIIDEILIAIEPHVSSTGRFAPNIPISNSIVITMKDTINTLVGWIQALDQGHISGAPGYMLRCFSLAIDIIGSSKLLDLFLDELDFAEAQGSFDYAMDVISGIIMIMNILGQHVRRGITNQINSNIIEFIENISEESIIQQRQKKRKIINTNGGIITNSSKNNTINTTTNTDLLIGSFRKLKTRIQSLQNLRKQQESLIPLEDSDDDLQPDDILDAVNIDISLEDQSTNTNTINNNNSTLTSLNTNISLSQSIPQSLDNDIIDPNNSVDPDGLADMGLIDDLNMGIGDDDLALGAGLDMSGFDTDEQLMLMDLT